MSKVYELIRLAQAEDNCDKHSTVQHNTESNVVNNCDLIQYGNAHKQANVPLCSVVHASVTK